MKQIVTIYIFLVYTTINCQTNPYNSFSIEANVGLVKPFFPLSPGFYTEILSPINTSLGARMMLNNRFGIKAEGSYNHFRFKNDEISLAEDTTLVDKSSYFRGSLIAVTNLGNVLNFRSKTARFGLLLNAGAGFSILKSAISIKETWKHDYTDIMINIVAGISPQYKINSKLALTLDFVLISNLVQTFAFDMNTSAKKQGFDGVIFNISAGISYYLGNKNEHLDWGEKL